MSIENKPLRVGTMVLTLNEKGQVLLGKRKNAFAAGEYGIPSGHVDSGETFQQAAVREVNEETGVQIQEDSLLLFAISNYIIDTWDSQYVTFDFLLTVPSESIATKEPHKNEGWGWYDLDKLPEPLHYPAKRTIEQYHQYKSQKSIVIS